MNARHFLLIGSAALLCTGLVVPVSQAYAQATHAPRNALDTHGDRVDGKAPRAKEPDGSAPGSQAEHDEEERLRKAKERANVRERSHDRAGQAHTPAAAPVAVPAPRTRPAITRAPDVVPHRTPRATPAPPAAAPRVRAAARQDTLDRARRDAVAADPRPDAAERTRREQNAARQARHQAQVHDRNAARQADRREAVADARDARRLDQAQQQLRIREQQQSLLAWRQGHAARQLAASNYTLLLQQQNRAAQARYQQAYFDRLRSQYADQWDRGYDYGNDPYYYTAPSYRYQRDGRSYTTNRYGADMLRQALNTGYEQGRQAGLADRQDQWRYSYRDAYAYQDANYGYDGRYIGQDDYNHYFREGFERGYEDGYHDRGQYGQQENGNFSLLGAVLTTLLGLQDIR